MAVTVFHSAVGTAQDAGRTYFQQQFERLRKAHAKRKVFRTSYSELARLSDRELKDLGIPRSGIKARAMEAAYGN